MKKFLLVLSAITLATSLFAYFILFDGSTSKFFTKWQEFTREYPSLPLSAYKTRKVNSAKIEWRKANKIIFTDNHLFWKGSGAVALPEVTQSNKLVNLIIKNKGKGYSDAVTAHVEGAQGSNIVLGIPYVKKGQIQSIPIKKTGKWNSNPLAFHKGETKPFSGISETILPSGIPVFSKEYKMGQKHGTHIFWFDDPHDPDDYTPRKSRSGELLPSLWAKVRDEAEEKFGEDNLGSGKTNKWVVETYRLKGGEFQVRLLEHWRNNRKNGLFEGFDYLGNKTFKDEYKHGLRIKHKIFDKTK
jgi:hypothetical protein